MFAEVFILEAILQHVTNVFKKAYKNTATKMRLSSYIALYMDKQALIQWYPEIHVRIDCEDFMKKANSGFNLIEYRLTDDEIVRYEEWLKSAKITPVSALNYCAEKEIKVSLTFSTNSESWCASLTGREDNKFNSGATLTNWSDDALDALYLGIYKATIIFQDGKWNTRKSANRG